MSQDAEDRNRSVTMQYEKLAFSKGLAEVFGVLNSAERINSFMLLVDGWTAKRVSEEESISRSTLQNYVNDFKRTGLIAKEGNSYLITRKGEAVRCILSAIDEAYPVILTGSILDEVQATGLEVDEDDIQNFQAQLLMQSKSYNKYYPWEQVVNTEFWEALGRKEMVSALRLLKTTPEVFHPAKTFNVVLSNDELDEFAKDPDIRVQENRLNRLWLLFEEGELLPVEEVVDREGYWRSELIEEVDFEEYGSDWDRFFSDFSEDDIKDIFGEGSGERLIEQYGMVPESVSLHN